MVKKRKMRQKDSLVSTVRTARTVYHVRLYVVHVYEPSSFFQILFEVFVLSLLSVILLLILYHHHMNNRHFPCTHTTNKHNIFSLHSQHLKLS